MFCLTKNITAVSEYPLLVLEIFLQKVLQSSLITSTRASKVSSIPHKGPITAHFYGGLYIAVTCRRLFEFIMVNITWFMSLRQFNIKSTVHKTAMMCCTCSYDNCVVTIVANRPGMAGTVPEFWPMSRSCPG